MVTLRGKRRVVVDSLLSTLENHWRTYKEDSHTREIGGFEFVIQPSVFNGADATSTRVFVDGLTIPRGASVLDMGCGFGSLGILAAARGAGHVVMVDVNPAAVANAKHNIERLGFADRAEAHQSDLFSAVAGKKFDVVLFNGPFLATQVAVPPDPRTFVKHAPPRESYFDPGYKLFDRFFSQLGDHLAPGGHVLFAFGNAGDPEGLCRILDAYGLGEKIVREEIVDPPGIEFYLLEITPRS